MFDTLTYARDMERAGFSRDQAEALASGQAKLIDDRLATKDDLDDLRIAVKSDLNDLRVATKADLNDLQVSTKADLQAVRTELRSDIGGLKVELGGFKRDIDDLRKEVFAKIDTSQRETSNRMGLLFITLIGAATAILGFLSRIPH